MVLRRDETMRDNIHMCNIFTKVYFPFQVQYVSNWDIIYEWSQKKKTTKIFHDKEAEAVPRILETS